MSRLVVLTNENASPQDSTTHFHDDNFNEDGQSTRESTPLPDSTDRAATAIDIEDTDRKLQEAIDEMNRLDTILAALQLKEKQLKLQGRKIKKQLWGELMSTPRRCEYPGEAENTKLFLALEAPHAAKSKVEADFQPVFGTQPPDDNDIDNGHVERTGKKNMTRSTKSCEDSDAPQGKKKQDFVKKNIELAGAAGGLVPMTPAEKERLAELLREIDEEDEREKHPPVGGPRDCEGDAWVLSVPTGHGYTPDPAQLEELRYIDSRLNLLCPVEDLWSMQSSFVNSSMSQGPGSDSGWELGRETWATGGGEGGGGGATGRETEERAGDAACPGDATEAEEMTSLGEEQLRSLLDECELTQSSNPQPAISDALLAALLRDPYTSSLAHLGHS